MRLIDADELMEHAARDRLDSRELIMNMINNAPTISARGEMTHELKILPEYFYAIYSGQKRFEIRKNDRNYRVGDTLRLLAYDGEQYTGEAMSVKVTYILNGSVETEVFGLKRGYCVMSIL